MGAFPFWFPFYLIDPSTTGPQLKKNLEKAWKWSKTQTKIATALTDALDPKLIDSWTAMLDAYYRGSSPINPFEEPLPS